MPAALRHALAALRSAMANDGIRRFELAWMLGIAADTALFVVLLVVAFDRGGVLATGVLGALRMAPAVVSGAASGAALRRWSGRTILVATGAARAAIALLVTLAILKELPIGVLFLLAAGGGAAGALVRPTQATLMPALARTPDELVAANVAWGIAEGVGALAGPALAAGMIAAGLPAGVAAVAALGFGATVLAAAGLRFEQALDAGAGAASGTGVQLVEGLRVLRRRPVPRWSMVAVFSQTMTRGILNAMVVVAAVELLGLGDPGVGTLNAAMGVGGLAGGIVAMSLLRPSNLVPIGTAALALWGLPIALMGLAPDPVVALAAMAVIGIANAAFDGAIFTIFQRSCSNAERGPVFAVFEAVAGLGVVVGSLLGPALVTALGNRGGMVAGGAIVPVVAVVIAARIGRLGGASSVDEATVGLLRRVPAFGALPLTGIERLAGAATTEAYPPGSVLMRQGEAGDRFVVLAQGEVEVLVDDRSVGHLGAGAGIGEVALLRSRPRTATVVALTAVEVVSVGARDFCAAVSGPAALGLMERVIRERLAPEPSPTRPTGAESPG